jgi:hypothetical protein
MPEQTRTAETPAAAGEPWPDWLEDLTPAERVTAIVEAVAACYTNDVSAPKLATWMAAEFLGRMLSEAADSAVPSAEHAQLAAARAALCRLALDEPVTDLGPGNHAYHALHAEMRARREHAAGALETIARLGEPETAAELSEPAMVREVRGLAAGCRAESAEELAILRAEVNAWRTQAAKLRAHLAAFHPGGWDGECPAQLPVRVFGGSA